MKRLLGRVKSLVLRSKLWLMAALAVLLVAGGGWQIYRIWPALNAPHTQVQPADPNKLMEEDWLLRLNHVSFRGVANGKIVWEVYAEHVDLTKDSKSYVVGGLKKMALVKDGKQELTLTADGLRQDIASGDINVYGSVMVMGKDLTMHTPGVLWLDRLQLLFVPQKLSAQFGDIAVVAEQGARYSVNDTSLHSSGKIMISCGGSVFNANGIDLNGKAQTFTAKGPVSVKYMVTDVEQWVEGQNLPKIPDIPESALKAYRKHCRESGKPY